MSESSGGLRAARERTIDALCQRFADESLSMSELERRLTQAREARSRRELDALLSDLPPGVPAPGPARQPATRSGHTPAERTAPAELRKEGERRPSSHAAIAILGGSRRAGRWTPPDTLLAIAMMGGVDLDFRDAVLGPDGVEVTCFAFWGGIEITVPPDVHVDTHGFALLGGFEQGAERETTAGPEAPTIRITGFALMGGVDVKVRERGDRKRKKGAR